MSVGTRARTSSVMNVQLSYFHLRAISDGHFCKMSYGRIIYKTLTLVGLVYENSIGWQIHFFIFYFIKPINFPIIMPSLCTNRKFLNAFDYFHYEANVRKHFNENIYFCIIRHFYISGCNSELPNIARCLL